MTKHEFYKKQSKVGRIIKKTHQLNEEDMQEEDFWELIREGDNKAFSELYDKYADTLYKYGMKMVQDNEQVEEAIQTVFVTIFERRRFISRPISMGAYLYTAMRNAIFYEKRKVRPNIVSLDDEISGNNGAMKYNFDLEIDPCSKLIQNEADRAKTELLQQLLNSLDGKQREIIYLRYYKGLSVEEIAGIFNTNSHQIHKATSRIIKRFREQHVPKKAFILFILHVLKLV